MPATLLKLISAGLLCALLSWPSLAAAKDMHWSSLTVHLQIDEQGLLHITERHAMVFDGDWNGGERTFQWRRWQHLELVSITEILPETGTRIALTEGDLNGVEQYRLADKTLRWRNRLSTDPPFANTEKTYEIVYTIAGALLTSADGNTYQLDHDLAFPDRNSVIEHFEATIDLAPVWQADLPKTIERDHLQPGQSVFVAGPLRYVGSGRPSSVAQAPEIGSTTAFPLLRYAALAIVIALAVLMAMDWLRSERALGRFEPPMSIDAIDEAWLGANVFNMKAEVVGATWDRNTSSAEVAALIARLVQEGKLSSSVTRQGWAIFSRDVLQLKLLRPREDFESYERRLIDHLFFDRKTEVDTDQIRAHYKTKGFNPAQLIESPLRKKAPAVFKARFSLPAWRKWMTAGLLVTGAALMALSWIRSTDGVFLTAMSLVAITVLYVIGLVFAYIYSENVHDLLPRAIRAFVVPVLMVLGLAWVLFGRNVPLMTLQLLAIPLLVLGALNSIFNTMHCREMPKGMQLRRALGSARRYFERELASEQPRLKDEWFPYLLAFGLGPNVDRWFKVFGSNRRTDSHFGGTSGPSSGGSSSTSSSTWSGGGGAFSGGGASGSWAAAVAGVAAGVSEPSSGGSGGGGGGGGGGSSGGGGGGGW